MHGKKYFNVNSDNSGTENIAGRLLSIVFGVGSYHLKIDQKTQAFSPVESIKSEAYFSLAFRAPYECVFAHRNKEVRYRGLVKVQFKVGIRALVFNLQAAYDMGIDRITLCHA